MEERRRESEEKQGGREERKRREGEVEGRKEEGGRSEGEKGGGSGVNDWSMRREGCERE